VLHPLSCCIMTSLMWAGLLALGVAASIDVSFRADEDANQTCSSPGATCGNVLLQHTQRGMDVVTRQRLSEVSCDESTWPNKDHGLVCGECKVLVNRFNSHYGTCTGYCSAVGRECVAAWEEENDNCVVKYAMTCDQTIASSDAICECGAELGEEGEGDGESGAADICFGELGGVAVDEGAGIGVPEIAGSEADCKAACAGNGRCQSFTYCPQWRKCWLKAARFNGGEATQSSGSCKTMYKKSCTGGSSSPPHVVPSPPPASSASATIKVVSYNLYWWNAHDQNPWKFDAIANNIKNTLKADTLGLQECDDPNVIKSRTGYEKASPFKGAQGVSVKPGLFRVGRIGSRDIKATGKWGPRYVTWAELTHLPSGRTFFHFNTHWCVHSGNGHTCHAGTRYTGAQNILEAIRQEAGSLPVVITGDFNAGMGEDGPQHFIRHGFTLAKSSWVDAIFFSSDHWNIKSTAKGDPANSDHSPVIAVLELK